jgi:hypothetical protein
MDTIASAVINFNLFALTVASSVVVTLIAPCLLKKILPRNLVNAFTNSAYFLKMVIGRNISKNTYPKSWHANESLNRGTDSDKELLEQTAEKSDHIQNTAGLCIFIWRSSPAG